MLGVLWEADRPLTPSEVRDRLPSGLAYTTVMTVLTRLWNKGLTSRERRGRAYAYGATVSESQLAADRMRRVLDGSSDRLATMSRFVDGLSEGEADALRRALRDLS